MWNTVKIASGLGLELGERHRGGPGEGAGWGIGQPRSGCEQRKGVLGQSVERGEGIGQGWGEQRTQGGQGQSGRG